MTQTAEVAAFRASLSKAFGGARTEPEAERVAWTQDIHRLVDLGVLSLLDPEEGAGLDGLPFAIAASQQLAVALHAFPTHAVIAASMLGPDLRERLDAPDAIVATGWMDATATSASTASTATLTGSTKPVPGVDGLTHLVLEAPDQPGSYHLVELDQAGITSDAVTTLDVTRSFSRILLDSASVIATFPNATPPVSSIGRLLLVAETAALVANSVSRTVDYARERTTFGNPIGQYQAVQHRLVDHSIAARQMEDLLEVAADALISQSPDADRRVLVAETYCFERAHRIVSDCIQLTGGIGFTWEYGLHQPLRRVSANAQLVGGARRAKRELADSLGW